MERAAVLSGVICDVLDRTAYLRAVLPEEGVLRGSDALGLQGLCLFLKRLFAFLAALLFFRVLFVCAGFFP